jgi:D-alanine-D-alanine ligase
MGEDGCIQGLLELAGVPYVGSGVLGSAVGMDKDVMKRLLAQADIPIVPYETVRSAEWRRDRNSVLQRCISLVCPLFVKPANLGSSVGVTKVKDHAALAAAIDVAFEYDTKVVIEQGIEGVREIECSVLGDEDPIASIPGEIVVDHPDGFYSYAAKYIDEHGATTRIPADLTPAEVSAVQLLGLQTFRTLEGSGLARIDFFMDNSRALYVNEINTLPGFTQISMYPKLWEATGIAPRELVTRLIDIALSRAERRRKLRTSA